MGDVGTTQHSAAAVKERAQHHLLTSPSCWEAVRRHQQSRMRRCHIGPAKSTRPLLQFGLLQRGDWAPTPPVWCAQAVRPRPTSPAPSSHPNQAANLGLCDGQHSAEAELRGLLDAVGDGDAGLLSTLEAPGTVGLVVHGHYLPQAVL